MKPPKPTARPRIIGGVVLTVLAMLPGTKTAQGGPESEEPTETSAQADSADYFLALGASEEAAGHRATALRHYEAAARYAPRDPAPLRKLIALNNAAGRSTAALDAMEKLHGLTPADAAGLQALAEAYFSSGQWAKAAVYGKKLAAGPRPPQGADYLAGVALYNIRDYPAALPYLQRAAKAQPGRADVPYYIGRTYLRQGAYNQALPYYARHLSMDSSQPMRAYEYAVALTTAGRPGDAIVYFGKALEWGYEAGDDFYTNMAYAFADARQTDRATRILSDLLKKQPQNQSLRYALAETQYAGGHYRDAIRTWDDILKEEPRNARVLYQIGLSYIRIGKTGEGQQLCDKAIEMDPGLAGLRQKRMSF